MPLRALSLGEVAAELGRSEDWLARHWSDLVSSRGMPAPIHEKGGLVWSAPAIHAWLVRDLPADLQALASAYRAALEAAREAPADRDEIETWRARLDARITSREPA